MPPTRIHQIYYDEPSRNLLDPGFIPLDNTANERPDWFEFWVIRKFLLENQLEEHAWYGFLSPRFRDKTGVDAGTLAAFIEFSSTRSDVALVSSAWDHVAYFQNPFEQGEVWHPGITEVSQAVVDHLGLGLDLSRMVAHAANFAFSNFVVAKAAYWRQWLTMANDLFSLAERGPRSLRASLNAQTSHGSNVSHTPMKVFVQERLPFLVISRHKIHTSFLDRSASGEIDTNLFAPNHATRGLLQSCDLLKRRFTELGDSRYFDAYRTVRSLIDRVR
jgi:hypothetical protein